MHFYITASACWGSGAQSDAKRSSLRQLQLADNGSCQRTNEANKHEIALSPCSFWTPKNTEANFWFTPPLAVLSSAAEHHGEANFRTEVSRWGGILSVLSENRRRKLLKSCMVCDLMSLFFRLLFSLKSICSVSFFFYQTAFLKSEKSERHLEI